MGEAKPVARIELLAQKIEAILRSGIILSGSVTNFIDSTFSNPTVDELQEILDDPAHCEVDGLLELIFFPDEDTQLKLEDTLSSANYQPEDLQGLLTHLLNSGLRVPLRFADKRETLKIALPREAAAQFISRLNISKRLDKRLVDTIAASIYETWQNAVKVRLRNARLDLSENTLAFLCAFFRKIRVGRRDFFDCLDFTLSLFDELKDDKDIFQALMLKKRFYLKNYQTALRQERLLKQNNMETLLLQGVRLSYVDKASCLKTVSTIDRISRAVFGTTEQLDAFLDCRDLAEVGCELDIQKIVRMLS